uniref:VTT domain-containing protein n=2 Tax=Globisporangium ultimum (strain ATCC 200006 / CBS 805.95 / DAOM BR144) TaxID=431595 RepID=K3X5H0_GLOUD
MASNHQDAPHRVAAAAPHATRDSLVALALKLVLVFGGCFVATLSLCSLLLQRVRDEDARRGLATSKLDQLSIRSFSSLAELQRSHDTFVHIFDVQFPLALLCFACVYAMKQTFAIPGSAVLNLFAGALLPLPLAFPLVCALTACGASFCYLLSRVLASEAIVTGVCDRLLPNKLAQLRLQIEKAKREGELLYMLLFLRVFPFSPNWFLNLASPWLQVPLYLFTPSVALGLMPYNFITVQAGAMLSTLTSTSDMLDPKTVGSLVLLALGMLVPAIVKKQRHNNVANDDTTQQPAFSKKDL